MVTTASPRLGVQMVSLRDIYADPALNPRAGGTPEDVAAEWSEAVESGDEFPPAVVFRDRFGKLWLAEGFVRRRAYELAGKAYLPADVREGDRRAAALHAAGSNRRNGLRRTNADKRRAVEIVLRECQEWSDGRVAAAAGVSQPFVGTVRAEVITVMTSAPVRVGLDGKAYPVPAVVCATGVPRVTPVPVRPPVIGPHRPEDFAPDVDDSQARLDAACLALAEVADYAEFLAGKGCVERAEWVRRRSADLLDVIWDGRPGRPPGH